MTTVRFDGSIAGVGTASGLRVVVGHWPVSPLGPVTDAMVQDRSGHRILLAPDPVLAELVAATYVFDEVRVVEVSAQVDGRRWSLRAGPLSVELEVGRRTALGALLRCVPRPLATSTAWARALDPVVRRVLPGVRTAGSARDGRREHYGALDQHRLTSARVAWDGADCGPLAPVVPPVTFGFGSTPRTPVAVRVVSTVEVPPGWGPA